MEGSAHAEVVRAEELHSNEAPQGASFLGINTVAIGRLRIGGVPSATRRPSEWKRFASGPREMWTAIKRLDRSWTSTKAGKSQRSALQADTLHGRKR